MDKNRANQIGRMNASTALDQAVNYPSKIESVASYLVNVVDSCRGERTGYAEYAVEVFLAYLDEHSDGYEAINAALIAQADASFEEGYKQAYAEVHEGHMCDLRRSVNLAAQVRDYERMWWNSDTLFDLSGRFPESVKVS